MRPVLATGSQTVRRPRAGYEPVPFAALAGWTATDPRPALAAFKRSCPRLGPDAGLDLEAACVAAAPLDPDRMTVEAARAFFEQQFVAHRVVHVGEPGLLTGYFEPELWGSREPVDTFRVPIYRRPPELIALIAESQRGTVGEGLSHARQGAHGFEAMPTRAEIEAGALAGRGLELLYLEDAVDVFILHVQGSGVVRLPGGERVRVTYDGKNGHPYTSIGRHLIETGEISARDMSLAALADWLRADPVRGRRTMWRNASFVFFRELQGEEAGAPLGVDGIPLTAGASLAIDTGVHPIGIPVWVAAPTLTHAGSSPSAEGFARLMIAQDTGSAIRGPERGDVFFGSGPAAGALAGVTRHPATFHVFLPRGGRP